MAHDRADLANCLMVSRICLSSILRSVTTMAESKSALPSLGPNLLMDASAKSRRTTSNWW